MDIGIISNQVSHYTGGRYLGYMAAVALAERGHEVTTYSDRAVPFTADFRGYKQPKVIANRRMAGMIGKHDVFLGIPPYGGQTACQLARKYRTRAVVYLFDVLPLMVAAGRRDHGTIAAVYAGLVRWVATTNTRVMVLAKHNRAPAASWLQIPENRIDVVYPAVNMRRIPEKLSGYERGKRVVWISRILPHKLFPHFLEAVKPFDVDVDVICARADRQIVDRYGMAGAVRFHIRITDEEKFGILADARLLVFSSSFEGFGMAPIEAWACATPVAAYTLPTLREVVGPMEDMTYWAPLGNRWALQHAVFQALSENKAGKFDPDRRFGMDRLGADLERVLRKTR